MEPMAIHPVEKNGVTFYPGDLNALMSVLYTQVRTDFISRRCNRSARADEIEYDEDGRAIQSECRDMNPGSLYVIAANLLGIQHKGFVVDRTWDSQVWNQPVRGYEITKLEEVDAEKAQELVSGKKLDKLVDDKEIEKKQKMAGSFEASKDGKISLVLTGSGDADLYVRVGEAPTYKEYDCRPYHATSNETCKVDVKKGDKVFWMVAGYAKKSTVSLTKAEGKLSEKTYAYNDHAERFFNVTMQLKWITEASPQKRISNPEYFVDHHTRTDTYTFVLECDKDGNIIGGEYTGRSKKFHTDFLWIPKSQPRDLYVGEFKIEYEKVKELNDRAAEEENGDGGSAGAGGAGGSAGSAGSAGTGGSAGSGGN